MGLVRKMYSWLRENIQEEIQFDDALSIFTLEAECTTKPENKRAQPNSARLRVILWSLISVDFRSASTDTTYFFSSFHRDIPQFAQIGRAKQLARDLANDLYITRGTGVIKHILRSYWDDFLVSPIVTVLFLLGSGLEPQELRMELNPCSKAIKVYKSSVQKSNGQ